jgi:electron transport complex protein RnfB
VGASGALEVFEDRGGPGDTVWQIDPHVCIACGNCATYCVLTPSAVKCVRSFRICGYCDLCTAFFELEHPARNSGAENQLCPVGAITRTFVEEPYYEYTIDEELCIGCGKCVKGCTEFGNGSMFLQIKHDRCLNCNECTIAAACPSGAIKRVSAEEPYLLKGRGLRRRRRGRGDGRGGGRGQGRGEGRGRRDREDSEGGRGRREGRGRGAGLGRRGGRGRARDDAGTARGDIGDGGGTD